MNFKNFLFQHKGVVSPLKTNKVRKSRMSGETFS